MKKKPQATHVDISQVAKRKGRTAVAKRCAVFTLSLALVCAFVPYSAWAADADPTDANGNNGATASEAGSTDSLDVLPTNACASVDSDGFVTVQLSDLDEAVAQAHILPAQNAADGGISPLAATASTRIVDSLDLPAWALDLYTALEEGADNDGKADFLIDPTATSSYSSSRIKGTTYGTHRALKIDVSGSNSTTDEVVSNLKAVLYAFDHDHTEVFWTEENSLTYNYEYSSSTLYYTIGLTSNSQGYSWLSDYTSTSQIKSDIKTRDSQIDEIVGGLASGYTAAEAIEHFDNWLTTHNEYNTLVAAGTNYNNMPTKLPWECLSALEGKTGEEGPVCEGYARAFKVLCDTVGINCLLVVGDAGNSQDSTTGLLSGGEGHMWDQVYMGDGRWYIVDVTWDDPISSRRGGATSGNETTDYLLIGGGTVADGSEFWATHTATGIGYTSVSSDAFVPSGISYESAYALSDLTVSDSSIDPAFDPYTVFYTMWISTAISPLTFSATAADSSNTSLKLYTPDSKNGEDLSSASLAVGDGTYYAWVRVSPKRSSTSGGESYRITVSATSSMAISQRTAEMTAGQQLVLSVIPAADEYTTAVITWSSSDTSVATVNNSGVVTAVGEGTATITAATEKHSVRCTVTVGHLVTETTWHSDSSAHWHICSTCGEVVERDSHTFGGWETVRAATATKEGLQQSVCTVCGYAISITIPSLTEGGGTSFTTKDAIYEITGEHTVTYVSCRGKKSLKTIKIPATVSYEGVSYKVTAIAEEACTLCMKLKRVTIGANVTSVGESAFYGCPVLTKVVVGKKVKKIGKKAFGACENLKTVKYKTKVLKKIGAKAFLGCVKLKKFTLKSPKITKKSVKKALTGSWLNKIKTTKKLKKSYRKAFTKKNCGRRVKVK